MKLAPGLRLLWSFLATPNCPQMTGLEPRTKLCGIYRQEDDSKPRWDSHCLNPRKMSPQGQKKKKNNQKQLKRSKKATNRQRL